VSIILKFELSIILKFELSIISMFCKQLTFEQSFINLIVILYFNRIPYFMSKKSCPKL